MSLQPDNAASGFHPHTTEGVVADPLNAVTLPHHNDIGAYPVLPQLPGFEILDELGRGGMGVVYRARRVSNGQEVAIKVLLAGVHAGPLERERFRREATAIGKLDHVNVVRLLESGQYRGLAYVVLEFIRGGTLAERIDPNQPWAPTDAARLIEHLARAVHAAHEVGVVHRDIKPANVLFANDIPKLTDFGLAKSLLDDSEDRPATAVGAVLGTPSYVAPEQATGEVPLSPAVDVYALGAVLYELITGQPPFDGKTTLDTVLKVLNEQPTPPQKVRPEVPSDLNTIVVTCLRKKPEERYQSAAELADDLARFVAGMVVTVRPQRWVDRLFNRMPRRRTIGRVAAGLSFLVLLLLGGLGYQQLRTIQDQADRTARELAETRKQIAVAEAEAAKQKVLAADLRAKYDRLIRVLESVATMRLESPEAKHKISTDPVTGTDDDRLNERSSRAVPRLRSAIVLGRLVLTARGLLSGM